MAHPAPLCPDPLLPQLAPGPKAQRCCEQLPSSDNAAQRSALAPPPRLHHTAGCAARSCPPERACCPSPTALVPCRVCSPSPRCQQPTRHTAPFPSPSPTTSPECCGAAAVWGWVRWSPHEFGVGSGGARTRLLHMLVRPGCAQTASAGRRVHHGPKPVFCVPVLRVERECCIVFASGLFNPAQPISLLKPR
jgi:hypothetical protein